MDDITTLYRRVINRGARLRRLKELKVSEVILRSEELIFFKAALHYARTLEGNRDE